MATVPREWRTTNPWGPEANAARARGELVPLYYSEEMARWREFGRANIRDGDLLFRYGKSYNPAEIFTSFLLAGISDGRFSHNAIAHREGDTLYVYDAEPPPQGVRKLPFEFWVLDVQDHSLVVQRLKPEYRGYIPGAQAYLEDAYLRQVPFDSALKPDDERLYCSEMIEKAFRSAGLTLSEPLPIYCLPHYLRWLPLKPLLYLFTEIRVEQPVFAIGNEHYGTFGSPYLETVLDQGDG
jgi:hypothetical protein